MGSCNSAIKRRNCQLDKGRFARNGQKTRKLLTVYRCMHPQADVDRLYWRRKEGGRGLISIEDCMTIEENSLRYYIDTNQKQLLKEVCKENIIKERQSPKEKKNDH